MKNIFITLTSIILLMACNTNTTVDLQAKVDSLETELKKQAQPTMDMSQMATDHIIVKSPDLQWADAPPGLPKGAKVAVIEGNPGKAGLFTMRGQIPANYRIMPHTH